MKHRGGIMDTAYVVLHSIWNKYGKHFASWLVDKYGNDFVDKAWNGLNNKYNNFGWVDAECRYRLHLKSQHAVTRLLGHPKPINIEDIFSDVYLIDELTAFKRFSIDEMKKRTFELPSLTSKRLNANEVARCERRLYILGKPGAGKTTLLKYLVIQACSGHSPQAPIFVSLKDWADSGLNIISYIERMFSICAFPDCSSFVIEHLLIDGKAIVLFDGIDEVSQEDNKRLNLISEIRDFANRYVECQICITCRIAASDYVFENFRYVEIADFTDEQITTFAVKWFDQDHAKLARFLDELFKPDKSGLRDLARTPLLLALICLVFDETLSFPERKSELYKEAIDALLKKWDSSRNIRREDPYRLFSLLRKEQLLQRIAFENFVLGDYIIRESRLQRQIARYARTLPTLDADEIDGAEILNSIESQHGILIQRARELYSFSHLTFQEYFTAKYITEGSRPNAIDILVENCTLDNRWREVSLMASSLFENADLFIYKLMNKTHDNLHEDLQAELMVQKINSISDGDQIYYPSRGGDMLVLCRLMYLNRAIMDIISELKISDERKDQIMHNNTTCTFIAQYFLNKNTECSKYFRKFSHLLELEILRKTSTGNLFLSEDLILKVGLSPRTPVPKYSHTFEKSYSGTLEKTLSTLFRYIENIRMLLECLSLAATTDRESYEWNILTGIKKVSATMEQNLPDLY
jgi:hypothetical protein